MSLDLATCHQALQARDARFDETGEALFQAWLHRVMPFLDMSEALSQPEPGWFRGAVRRVLWR